MTFTTLVAWYKTIFHAQCANFLMRRHCIDLFTSSSRVGQMTSFWGDLYIWMLWVLSKKNIIIIWTKSWVLNQVLVNSFFSFFPFFSFLLVFHDISSRKDLVQDAIMTRWTSSIRNQLTQEHQETQVRLAYLKFCSHLPTPTISQNWRKQQWWCVRCGAKPMPALASPWPLPAVHAGVHSLSTSLNV